MTYIATYISSNKEKEELEEQFKKLDVDGNGVLTEEELVKGMRRFTKSGFIKQ